MAYTPNIVAGGFDPSGQQYINRYGYVIDGLTNPTLTEDMLYGGTLDPRITFTRADATSCATYFGSDGVLRVMPSNLALNCNTFTAGTWQKNGLGFGLAPVVTSNYGTDPLGGNNASRIVFDVQAGRTSGDYSQLLQNGSFGTGIYTEAVWLKSNTGSNCILQLWVNNKIVSVTVTPVWQLFAGTQVSLAASNIQIIYFGNEATSNQADVSVYAAALFPGTYTAAQILASGGIPLTTTTPNSNPRFEYDPVTLQPLGLRVEQAATNVFLNQDILGTNLVSMSPTLTAGSWTMSFTGTGTVSYTGAATGSLVGTGATTRVSTTFTATAIPLVCVVTGTVKFAQLESGTLATTFIVSGASPTTRAADIDSSTAVIPGAAGTVVIQAVTAGGLPASVQVLYHLDDAGLSNRMYIVRTSAGTIQFNTYAGGVTQASIITLGTVSNNTTFKVAIAWATGDFSISLNGAAPITASAGNIPSVTTRRLGMDSANAFPWNGEIQRVSEYSTRLPDASLRALAV